MQGTRGSYQLAGTQGKREDFFFSPWFCGLYSQKSRISGVCVCVCVCVYVVKQSTTEEAKFLFLPFTMEISLNLVLQAWSIVSNYE